MDLFERPVELWLGATATRLLFRHDADQRATAFALDGFEPARGAPEFEMN